MNITAKSNGKKEITVELAITGTILEFVEMLNEMENSYDPFGIKDAIETAL